MLLKRNRQKKIYDKTFLQLDGYLKALNIIAGNGYMFKLYRLPGRPDPAALEKLMYDPGILLQEVLDSDSFLLVIGYKLDHFTDPSLVFEKIEDNSKLEPLSFEDVFHVYARLLTGSPEGLPKGKRVRYTKQICPWNVRNGQKGMELSGRYVRTMMVTGFPLQYPVRLAEQLLSVEGTAISVHIRPVDPERILGTVILPGTDESRKAILQYIRYCRAQNSPLFRLSFFITLSGDQETVDCSAAEVKRLLESSSVPYSELDFQQKDGFRSTLPLLHNRIRYAFITDREGLPSILPGKEPEDNEPKTQTDTESETTL